MAEPKPTVDTLLLGYSRSSDQGSIGFAGVYLVTSGQRRILFDCGHTGRRRALHRALHHRGLGVRDINTLVLSHGHWDHLQNADLFGHGEVLVHPAELSYLQDGPADDPVTPPWTMAILAALPVGEVVDGFELAPGVTATGLPGHTEGSIGLTVETATGTAMLTGDAVSSARALATGRATAVHAGEAAAARSVALVRSRADLVYPGHDRPFTVLAGRPGDYLLPATTPDPSTPTMATPGEELR